MIVCIPFSFADIRTPEASIEAGGLDGESTDIIINVLKTEPTVLVDAVLRETNAPVYVSLYGVPTTGKGIPRIKHISIRETDTNRLSGGVRYYPPALYSWDNLGYFETKLKKIEKLSDIPDRLDVNLTAKIKYEAETTTQLIGAVQTKVLHEKFKVDKEDLYKEEHSIFGRGYIVANRVYEDKARFTIYDSETRKLGSPELKIDQESREFHLVRGSRFSEDIVRVRLDDIIDGSEDYVTLEIPSVKDQYDDIVVNVGDELGHGWIVDDFNEKDNRVFVKKKIDGKDIYIYLMEGNLDANTYRQHYEAYIKNEAFPYAQNGIHSDLLLDGLGNLTSDFTGGVVRVKDINKGKPKSASFEVAGNSEEHFLNSDIGDCKLKEIEADFVIISNGGDEYTRKLQTKEERERKDESSLKEEICGKRILLTEIHTQNIARATILTGRKRGEMETSFSLHIPVEKGLIGFTDKEIEHQLRMTDDLIEQFSKTVEKLEKIVTNWRKVCLGVTAILVVSKFFTATTDVVVGAAETVTSAAVVGITGGAVIEGEYYRLKSDDKKELFLDKKHVEEAWRKRGNNLLYNKAKQQIGKNIVYDEVNVPYYYKAKTDEWVVYKGLNIEEYRSVYTTRKDGESVIVVPIRDPENKLAAGRFRERYEIIKDEYALDKGFYVVFYEGEELEIYQGIGKIDLGYDDDRRAKTISKTQPGFNDFEDKYIKKVNEAQRTGKRNVDVNGVDYSIYDGREFKAPDLSCEDIYCPGLKTEERNVGTCWQCRILFNACDPVICPPSRCDLAGRVNPGDSVADKGLIASLVLCTPNIKWSRGGVMVPICLSGIYGSLKTIQSMLENYKLCLLKQQKEGKTFGLCERVQSIYICELVWKELAGWLMLKGGPVGGMLGLLTGGGTEYFTASLNERATNSRRVVDFFVQSYAKEMYVSYLGKSTEEVGTEICKSFVGGKLPNIGAFVDQFAAPEVPPQFTAHFEEQTYSETAGTSRYTVYYQVYAGTLRNKDRLSYYVYLRKKGARDLRIARGTLTAEESASDTVTEVEVRGYEEICVNIDGVPNCNFGKMVTSSWALDSLVDKFVEGQLGKSINSAEQCVSESEGYLGMPVERKCEVSNPYGGYGAEEEGKWEAVGDCGVDARGVYQGKCWMKVQSLEMIEMAKQRSCEEEGLIYCKEGEIGRGRRLGDCYETCGKIEPTPEVPKVEPTPEIKEPEEEKDLRTDKDYLIEAVDEIVGGSFLGENYKAAITSMVEDDIWNDKTLVDVEMYEEVLEPRKEEDHWIALTLAEIYYLYSKRNPEERDYYLWRVQDMTGIFSDLITPVEESPYAEAWSILTEADDVGKEETIKRLDEVEGADEEFINNLKKELE